MSNQARLRRRAIRVFDRDEWGFWHGPCSNIYYYEGGGFLFPSQEVVLDGASRDRKMSCSCGFAAGAIVPAKGPSGLAGLAAATGALILAHSVLLQPELLQCLVVVG